jgi:hypothetical protein
MQQKQENHKNNAPPVFYVQQKQENSNINALHVLYMQQKQENHKSNAQHVLYVQQKQEDLKIMPYIYFMCNRNKKTTIMPFSYLTLYFVVSYLRIMMAFVDYNVDLC